MKTPTVLFDPGAVSRPHSLKWVVTDYAGDPAARFAHRDDAEMFEQIIKRRPHRAIDRKLSE